MRSQHMLAEHQCGAQLLSHQNSARLCKTSMLATCMHRGVKKQPTKAISPKATYTDLLKAKKPASVRMRHKEIIHLHPAMQSSSCTSLSYNCCNQHEWQHVLSMDIASTALALMHAQGVC